jgi:hypothetical protein
MANVITVRFVLPEDLARKVEIGSWQGVKKVDRHDPAQITVRASSYEDRVDGLVMNMWLEDESGGRLTETTVYCKAHPECRKRTVEDDTRFNDLFIEALDRTLLDHNHGLGYLIITRCSASVGSAEIHVISDKGVALDRRFHYIIALYDASRKRVRETMHYEMKLEDRQSDAHGTFRPIGKIARVVETRRYLQKICVDDGQPKPNPLTMQIRTTELRHETEAANNTTAH